MQYRKRYENLDYEKILAVGVKKIKILFTWKLFLRTLLVEPKTLTFGSSSFLQETNVYPSSEKMHIRQWKNAPGEEMIFCANTVFKNF